MTMATADLSRLFAQQIASQALSLPTLPGTAAEVLQLCQQECTDAARLSAVLHRDQAIASHVLRVANSAAYAGQTGCASLQQAVSRLGMQLISEIALAVSVQNRLFRSPRGAELLTALWRHSALAGFFTKEIARQRRRNVEVAFLCGLLHDIGKALLLANLDQLPGLDADSLPLPQLTAALDEQHLAAGAQLMLAWRLPAPVAEAVVCHHEPALASCHRELAATVQLADLLSHHIDPGPFASAVSSDELRSAPVLAELNLYPDQLQALLQLRERALQVVEGLR